MVDDGSSDKKAVQGRPELRADGAPRPHLEPGRGGGGQSRPARGPRQVGEDSVRRRRLCPGPAGTAVLRPLGEPRRDWELPGLDIVDEGGHLVEQHRLPRLRSRPDAGARWCLPGPARSVRRRSSSALAAATRRSAMSPTSTCGCGPARLAISSISHATRGYGGCIRRARRSLLVGFGWRASAFGGAEVYRDPEARERHGGIEGDGIRRSASPRLRRSWAAQKPTGDGVSSLCVSARSGAAPKPFPNMAQLSAGLAADCRACARGRTRCTWDTGGGAIGRRSGRNASGDEVSVVEAGLLRFPDHREYARGAPSIVEAWRR